MEKYFSGNYNAWFRYKDGRSCCEIKMCTNLIEGNHTKCARHRQKCKMCRYRGCKKRPTFGDSVSGGVMYCHAHKKDGMVNNTGRVCAHEGCTTHSTYGYPGGKRLMCNSHKKDGMFAVSSRCRYKDCSKKAVYMFRGQTKPEMCRSHRLPRMINIFEEK